MYVLKDILLRLCFQLRMCQEHIGFCDFFLNLQTEKMSKFDKVYHEQLGSCCQVQQNLLPTIERREYQTGRFISLLADVYQAGVRNSRAAKGLFMLPFALVHNQGFVGLQAGDYNQSHTCPLFSALCLCVIMPYIFPMTFAVLLIAIGHPELLLVSWATIQI